MSSGSSTSTGSGSNEDSGSPGGERSLDHLYAQSLEGPGDQFNRRNGVFYPSGFALLALPAENVAKAVEVLTQGGTAESGITLLKPEQMRQLTDASHHDAGILSRIVSAELKQMNVLEQLADAGNHFLLVKSTEDNDDLLKTVSARAGASKGLLFHTLAVEELPVDKETIPGTSPFGVNEVIRTQDSDADMSGDHRP